MAAFALSRRGAVRSALVAAAATFGPSQPARAWCGERFPSWAYYLTWDERAVPFEVQGVKGVVLYRVVGDVAREEKSKVPPVLVVGTPGLGYEYLENLEALTVSDRRVIEVTFAGTGDGARAPAALRTVDAWTEQLRLVCQSLDVQTVHLVAHGLGAGPALQLASRAVAGSPAPRVRSLSLVSPFGTAADLREGARGALLSAPDGPRQSSLLLPTTSGNARGSCIAESRAAAGKPSLVGAGELLLASSGAEPLGSASLGQRLQSATAAGLPVLLATGGAADLVDAGGWDGVPNGVQRLAFTGSGHLPFIEQREQFLTSLLTFLDKADGVETNRELKFADPLATIKGLQSS